MKKRLKKQLKSDEFASILTRATQFIQSRVKEITVFVSVIVFAFIVFLTVRYMQLQNSKEESQVLGQILQLSDELDENPEKVSDLEILGGKGKFSRLAYLQMAVFYQEKGEDDKALEAIDKILSERKDIFYYKAQNLKAQVLEKQKEFDEALEIYKKIEQEDPKEYVLDEVLYNMAKIHVEKGEVDQAMALYKKIQEDFPQSPYAYEVTQEITKLEAKE